MVINIDPTFYFLRGVIKVRVNDKQIMSLDNHDGLTEKDIEIMLALAEQYAGNHWAMLVRVRKLHEDAVQSNKLEKYRLLNKVIDKLLGKANNAGISTYFKKQMFEISMREFYQRFKEINELASIYSDPKVIIKQYNAGTHVVIDDARVEGCKQLLRDSGYKNLAEDPAVICNFLIPGFAELIVDILNYSNPNRIKKFSITPPPSPLKKVTSLLSTSSLTTASTSPASSTSSSRSASPTSPSWLTLTS